MSCFGSGLAAVGLNARHVILNTQAFSLGNESDGRSGKEYTLVPKDSSEHDAESKNAMLDATAADEALNRHP